MNEVVFNLGDIYWVQAENSDFPHPHVVIIQYGNWLMMCALTTNLKRISLPGNVLIDAGEANLPKHSVVEVAKISIIEKSQLGEYIGSLSAERVNQIVAGIEFLQRGYQR